MKKIYLTILLLTSYIGLFAQEVEFTYLENRERINTPLGVAETNDGFVILSKHKLLNHTDYKLIKISLQGNFVKEQLILPEEYEETPEDFKITGITQSHADTIYVLGTLPASNNEYYEIFLACYDKNLNLIETHRMSTSYYGVPNYGRAKMNSQGNILFFGGINIIPPSKRADKSKNVSFICEINPQGTIEKLKLLINEPNYMFISDDRIYDVTEKPDGSGYILINDGSLQGYKPWNIIPHVEIDNSFEVVFHRRYFIDCYIAGTVFYDSDSTCIFTGNSKFSHKTDNNSLDLFPYSLGIMKYDTSHVKLKKVRFGNDSIENYSGMYGSSARDKVFPEYFYYSGTVNSKGTIIGMNNQYSYILVNKLDMNLNLKWQHKIGENDNAYYLNYVAHATNDGGVLLLNHVYRYGSSNINIHVVKIKGSGDGIAENDTLSKNHIIYPNPATDVIRIKTSDKEFEGILEISNISGQIVLRQPVNQVSTISVHNLEKGIYIYTIKRNNTVLKNGKWVKE